MKIKLISNNADKTMRSTHVNSSLIVCIWTGSTFSCMVLGRSNRTLLLASHEPDEAYKTAFDGVVAYYPTCREEMQTRRVSIPLQVHIGMIDEWASADRCKALQATEGFKSSEFNYYENTHHLFDGRSGGSAICYKGVPCFYGPNKEANDLSRERVKAFLTQTLN